MPGEPCTQPAGRVLNDDRQLVVDRRAREVDRRVVDDGPDLGDLLVRDRHRRVHGEQRQQARVGAHLLDRVS